MTVRIEKPAINVREELADLRKPSGVAGEAMLRAETPQEQFNLIGAGRRNLIINGAMQVAQRGTSFSSIGSATYTLDRWRGQSRASSVVNVTKVDNVDVAGRIMSVLQHQVTTPATDGLTLQNHFVEDGSISLLGQTVTVSCWARVTSGSATVSHRFEVDGGSTYFYESDAATLTGSFQRIVFTTTLSGYTTSISDKHLRYQLFIRGSSAHTVQITGVQLELGKVATPFEHRSYGEELALCQRYYQSFSGLVNYPATAYAANDVYSAFLFPSEMRAPPSITISSHSVYATGALRSASSTIAANIVTSRMVSFRVQSLSGVAAGDACLFYVNSTGDAEL